MGCWFCFQVNFKKFSKRYLANTSKAISGCVVLILFPNRFQIRCRFVQVSFLNRLKVLSKLGADTDFLLALNSFPVVCQLQTALTKGWFFTEWGRRRGGGHDFLGKRTKCIEWGHSWYSSCICDDMFCKHVNSIQRRTFEEARNTVGEGFYASIRNALNACIYGS